jgi:hypothetical protein
MGRMPTGEREPLAVHVTEDGRILVHVGTRFVEASLDELDRTLEHVAADGGSVSLSRDDPLEAPAGVALEVEALLREHDVALVAGGLRRDDLEDAGL